MGGSWSVETMLLISISVLIILILVIYIIYLKKKTSLRVKREIEEREKEIRKDALERSRAALTGKISEQMAPYSEDFRFNASDARFLGSPIDYVIFDGYTEAKDDKEEDIKIVIADIKKGEEASLTSLQRKIKEAVEENNVEWKTIQLE